MNDDDFESALPPSGAIEPVSDATGASIDFKKRRRSKSASRERGIDRLPPHSPEAEQGVLGCVLLSPKECLPIVIAKFNASDEPFYDLRHQTIFAHLMSMSGSDIAGIDIITLQQRLKDFQLLEQVGGIAYLNLLPDGVPSAANLSYYLEIVWEKFLLRKLIQTCTDVVGRVYDCEGEVDTILDEAERDVLRVGQLRVSGGSGSSGMRDLTLDSMQRIDALYQSRGRSISGIATGFPDLDRMTGGLRGGEMIVIAARPSLGKTSLALNIAEYVALVSKLPVGVFSLEMTKESLTDRLISSVARVNLRNLTAGFASESDFPRITNAAGRIAACPLRIDDTPALSIMALRARARSMWQQYGIKLFVVDYLQLMHSTSRRAAENRQLEVSEISGGLKALAKELNVPVIVLSQLNREIEQAKRKPRLADLRESGAIEQDADVAAFLYKPALDDEGGGAEEPDGVPVNLLIAKQRNGPTGDINLTFLKPYTRFESAAKVSDDDVPASQQTEMQPPLTANPP